MISTLTARGRRPPRTARSGCRLRCRWAGRRIVTVAGHGLLPGAGPGWMTRLGDSLPSTTAAGCIGIARGPGLPDRSATGTRIMLRHWWAGSADLGSASASDGDGLVAGGLVLASAGSRWAGVRRIIRATVDGDMAAGTTVAVG